MRCHSLHRGFFSVVVFAAVGFAVIVYVIIEELGILVVRLKLQTNKITVIARLFHAILHLVLTLNNDCSELPPDHNDEDVFGLDSAQQSDGDGVSCNCHGQPAHLHCVRRHCHRYWYPQKTNSPFILDLPVVGNYSFNTISKLKHPMTVWEPFRDAN